MYTDHDIVTQMIISWIDFSAKIAPDLVHQIFFLFHIYLLLNSFFLHMREGCTTRLTPRLTHSLPDTLSLLTHFLDIFHCTETFFPCFFLYAGFPYFWFFLFIQFGAVADWKDTPSR